LLELESEQLTEKPVASYAMVASYVMLIVHRTHTLACSVIS